MPIRLSGINSGLDTDTIVQALVSTYSSKKDKYKKQQTKLQWTQDAWKSLNTKVYSLYTNVSKLRFTSAYSLKKTSSSDPTKATVSAGNNAANGSQKLNILQVAQAGYLTGGKLAKGTSTSTTMAELGYTDGDAEINVDKGDGTSKTIKINSTSKVSDVIDQLKDAGLNASLDTANNRLFISAKDTGKDNDFNLIAANANGAKALAKLGLSTSLTTGTDENGNPIYSAAGEAYKKYDALYGDGTNIEDKVKDAVKAYGDAKIEYDEAVAQTENLRSSMTYAPAYAATKKYVADNAGKIGDESRFNSVISNSTNGSSLVDSKGNIYNATARTDTNGNTIYSNGSTYIAQEVTYTADGKTYRKEGDKYVDVNATADAGDEKYFSGDTSELIKTKQVAYYAVNEVVTYEAKKEDGSTIDYTNQITEDNSEGVDPSKKYSITDSDGKVYYSASKTGTYKHVSDDGKEETISINANYSYHKAESPTQEQQDVVAKMTTVSEAYEAYKDELIKDTSKTKEDIEKELSVYKENLDKVKAFESAVTDKEMYWNIDDGTGNNTSFNYSKQRIMEQVHDAYDGKISELGTGTEAVSKLVQDFAEKMSFFTSVKETSETTMKDNEVAKGIASIEDNDERDAAIKNMVKTVKEAHAILNDPNNTTGTATKMDGQDAVIKLNGAEFTSSTNNIDVNGITINAQATTGDGDNNAITITTATDSQGVYDKIKEFLTEYNSIMNEMSKLYNASSSKGFEPLTDEEKDAMSDKEVEKWESKIKDSLLRRDGTLGDIMNSMSSAMQKYFTINGKNYSLASFGIKTLGYFNSSENEKYAFHIDGDEEDTNTSGNEDRLMSMINSDPDTVMDFMKQLTDNLYKTLGNKMQRTSLSSSYTIYNDKQMDTQYKDYTKLIQKWEERISEKEDYYYNKFAKMESALASLNSTQSSLGGFFS